MSPALPRIATVIELNDRLLDGDFEGEIDEAGGTVDSEN